MAIAKEMGVPVKYVGLGEGSTISSPLTRRPSPRPWYKSLGIPRRRGVEDRKEQPIWLVWMQGRRMRCALWRSFPHINKFAEGSCLIRWGNTHVLCTASVEERTPPHVPDGEGLGDRRVFHAPRANRERSRRDISKLKLAPRSAEIQRLVGRALRAAVDSRKLGERTITIDCDVLQGDGGTRTASVTGGIRGPGPGVPEAHGGRGCSGRCR